MSTLPPAAELENVSFSYSNGEGPPVLEDVNLRIEADDYIGLIGPNGGGKTTLLKVLLGVLKPDSGTVRVLGQPPAQVRSRIGYVPQHARIDTSVPASVLDVVLMGRLSRSGWGISFGQPHRDHAREALRQTGVEHLADRTIEQISGGQRQRVLIARALASEAEILLLDEPTAGVDAPMEQDFFALLNRLNERLPVVLVSHDVSFVSSQLKRIACLNRRLVCHAASEVTAEILAETYEGHTHLSLVQHTDDCPTHPEDEESPEPERQEADGKEGHQP
jgi:zinc transport system ATP-binding protein